MLTGTEKPMHRSLCLIIPTTRSNYSTGIWCESSNQKSTIHNKIKSYWSFHSKKYQLNDFEFSNFLLIIKNNQFLTDFIKNYQTNSNDHHWFLLIIFWLNHNLFWLWYHFETIIINFDHWLLFEIHQLIFFDHHWSKFQFFYKNCEFLESFDKIHITIQVHPKYLGIKSKPIPKTLGFDGF